MRGRKKLKFYITVLLGLLLSVGCVLWSYQRPFQIVKTIIQTDQVPTGILRYGPMGKVLLQLGLISYSTNDFKRYQKTSNVNDIETVTFQKKRQVDDYLFKANPGGKSKFLSTKLAEQIPSKPGWPIISLAIDDKHLNDPEYGLLKNREKKGEEWEKVVAFSYIENGKVLFESYAGLRIHGGKRRTSITYKPGLRIYFRKRHGFESIPEGLVLPDTPFPIRTLVLRGTDWPPGFPMNDPLAYDISKQIGCKTPETRLVEVLINGESIGMNVATEHISRRQWGQRFAGLDYSIYKFKSRNGPIDEKLYHKYFWATLYDNSEFGYESVSRHIDLDNLSRHLFSLAYAGDTDFCQGAAIYETGTPEPKVSWVNWDMDHSFYDRGADRGFIIRNNWEQGAFDILFSSVCGRTRLFSKLIQESTQFKNEFLDLVVEILNHRLTEDFLHKRVSFYETMMKNFGEPHVDYVKLLYDFVDNRSVFIWDEIKNYFDVSNVYSFKLESGDLNQILIDGYVYQGAYSGKYLPTSKISLAPLKEDEKKLHYWIVNGEKITRKSLELTLTENTVASYVSK